MKNLDIAATTRIATFAAFALILFLFEALAPRILPWMKLGLGNLVTLLVLLAYGFPAALSVALVKLLVGGLVTGTLAGPAFLIGGGAGMVSLTAMAVSRRLLGFSTVGLSVLGAVAHQLAQLMLARAYLGIEGLSHFLPLFLAWGLISGGIVGLIVHWVIEKLRAGGWLEVLE